MDSETRRLKKQIAAIHMMDAVKAGMVYQLSEKLIELAIAYKNLSKELTYYIATKPSH